jgi:hypothetical protein
MLLQGIRPANIAISLCLAIFAFVQPLPAACADNVDVFVLKQRSDVFGAITTYVGEKHLKIVIGKPTTYLVASAPEWKVMVANDLNGRALSMSYKQWMEHFPQTTYIGSDWDRCKLTVIKGGEARLFGRPCLHYYFPYEPPAQKTSTARLVKGDYYLLDVHYKDPSVCHILEKAVSAPILPAVPVIFSQTENSSSVVAFSSHFGGTDHWLGTESIKESKLPASFFAYPKGYKLVGVEAEVMDDKNKKDSVDDVARELMPR